MYEEETTSGSTCSLQYNINTPTVPENRSIRHQSHLLRKSLNILNIAHNYTVAREAHRVSNIRWVAIDSGTSGNYYPSGYQGKNHNPLAPYAIVGVENDAAMKSKAQDTIRYKKIPTKAKICHKFDKITTQLVSVSQLCKIKLTVTFNNKGVLVNNSEGEVVMRAHLDLGSNLYMVPVDNTVQYEAPKDCNVFEISQHRVYIAYRIKCVPKFIRYLHAAAGFPVKEM